MHIPAAFALDEVECLERLESRPFGILATIGEDGLEATHLPILIRKDPLRLVGHVARSNPQATRRPETGLLIWSGPDAYVSPSYYPSKAVHGRVVPTWNYEAVHVEGALTWFDDLLALRALIAAETDLFEKDRPHPWSVEDAPESYVEGLTKGIVGFELSPRKIAGARKFSQNRSPEDREGVRRGLLGSPDALERRAGETMTPVMRA
jgi:transcriptional regulator